MFTKTPKTILIQILGLLIGSIITLSFLELHQSISVFITTTIGYFLGVYNTDVKPKFK